MTELRVLVLADDPLVRTGLARLLAAQAGLTIVGQAGASGAAESIAAFRPDVVLWDSGWGNQRGEILGSLPDGGPPLLALVNEPAGAEEVWAAGVRGLLLRSAGGAALSTALQGVAQGHVVLDPDVASVLLRRIEPQPEGVEELTPRERQVLGLLAQGLANKEIADRLEVSESTAKFHVNAIMGKLGARSRTDAVVKGTRLGLIAL